MTSSTTVADLCTQLRLLLQSSSSQDAIPFDELLARVDTFVLECSASPDSPLHELEDELQVIYHDFSGGHALFPEVDKFLTFLYHLRPVLPSHSIISTWFELVLGPTLREPKLLVPAVNYAKELILSALDPCSNFNFPGAREGLPEADKQKERVGDFRRRLMDYYLLDAFNENSGDDVLEWAELDREQREKKACWKANLEDVLIRVGLERPNDFLTEMYRCFIPTYRLQLLILLNTYTSQPTFPEHAHTLATHPLMTSLLDSLIFDNSSTVATVALTTLIKVLPIFAIKACEELKRHLPMLLVVLARILCWKERQSLSTILPVIPDPDETDEDDESYDNNEHIQGPLVIRDELQWERLELTFDGPQSKAPSPHRYFTFLYYLFPCNTIRFLRYPVRYLRDNELECPFIVGWEEALDEDKIRSKSERSLRMHVLHPLLIWREASEELKQPDFWAQYDIPQIVSGARMLDVRNAGLGLRQQQPNVLPTLERTALPDRGRASRPPSVAETTPPNAVNPDNVPLSSSLEIVYAGEETAAPAEPARLKISLSDMVATSVALRSGLDVEVVDATTSWAPTLFPLQPSTRSPSRVNRESSQPAEEQAPAEMPVTPVHPGCDMPDDGSLPRHVAEAISGLQREVLLLKNDLNLELWTARENVKHIGRLYKERVLSKNEEFERQGLQIKMKEYRREVSRLRHELKEEKGQAVTQRVRYTDWNRELQDRVSALREEKKKWEIEAAAMRAAEKEAKDTFAAQGKLLAEASQAVFRLETRAKENAHKVDRLYDYEMQIEQLMKLQRLWESDVQKLNDNKEFLAACASEYKKMELRLHGYEHTQSELKGHLVAQRQRIARLENELDHFRKQPDTVRRISISNGQNETPAEYRRVLEVNERLREENGVLQEEIEEVKAMLDVLKREKSGRTGLVGADSPRSSPPLMIL